MRVYFYILTLKKMLTLSNFQCFFGVCMCLFVREEKEVNTMTEEKVKKLKQFQYLMFLFEVPLKILQLGLSLL